MKLFLILLALNLAKPDQHPGLKALKKDSGISWSFPNSGVLEMAYRSNLIENPKYQLEGSVIVDKNLLNNDPMAIGGAIMYRNKVKKNTFEAQIFNEGYKGVQVGAKSARNIYLGKKNAVNVGVVYGQHFGGPEGSSRPVLGAVVKTTL
ncbi:uncharacterized protein LOC107397777 [Tribolium castaneum]|uniref:Attacin C-terminal domain-containing protein n=1 Tax=Tribolium castaneum TaxID=7070 RepID=D2A1G8_TRICA|nr:PREDICTED: uncharacterized protein LOC107397777 [Tribolium castaneum]EFA02856.1 hypothetical protein TcasGA2_TC007739 [Tribolium castaneum]|eukprot:XP_015834705.1 PREDICTED: uncharacterized protein LOC107397777 [Tribolium castaneum]